VSYLKNNEKHYYSGRDEQQEIQKNTWRVFSTSSEFKRKKLS